MSDKKYVVWSLEHAQWWAPNSMGYTHDFTQAGRFHKEEADAICESANVGPKVNEMLAHSSDMRKLIELQKKTEPLNKPAIENVLQEFTQGYHATNPLGKVLEKLRDNHHYPEDVIVPHVNYETTEKVEIPLKNDNKKIVASLYRMPSGSYECVLYTGQKNDQEYDIKNKQDSMRRNRP